MRDIRRVAVLGAGTMGSQIAAHIANAGVPCVLLDRPPEPPGERPGKDRSRNRLAQAGIETALKAHPPAFFLPGLERLISPGNFDDHLSWLR
ncbi:MAG: 3-hydroxyacyl-CoA dehydrogenase NAD-binding domain-containing protein, partial [Terriglobia bacterium]